MNKPAPASLASIPFESFLGARVEGETRKALWAKAAPEMNPADSRSFYEGIATALVNAGLVEEDNKARAAGLLSALAVGNQSQIRQLINGEDEKAKPKSSLANLLAGL